jgi:hypothetical protein
VSDAKALDASELLRLLAEQQTCLGQQLTMLGELQRLVIEHLLRGNVGPGVTAMPSPATSGEHVAEPVPNDAPSSPASAQSSSGQQAEATRTENAGSVDMHAAAVPTNTTVNTSAAASPPPEISALQSASMADSPIGEPLAPLAGGADAPTVVSAPTAVNSRAGRYLQPHARAVPARRVTSQDLNRVARLYEVGEAAHLVLQFGEYRGISLVQVAQADPDYIRSLALTAQRPQVRAAASALVRALELSERSARRPRRAGPT